MNALTWTKELPQQPGLYAFRRPDGQHGAVVLRLDRQGVRVWDKTASSVLNGCEFAGPIHVAEPQEPTVSDPQELWGLWSGDEWFNLLDDVPAIFPKEHDAVSYRNAFLVSKAWKPCRYSPPEPAGREPQPLLAMLTDWRNNLEPSGKYIGDEVGISVLLAIRLAKETIAELTAAQARIAALEAGLGEAAERLDAEGRAHGSAYDEHAPNIRYHSSAAKIDRELAARIRKLLEGT